MTIVDLEEAGAARAVVVCCSSGDEGRRGREGPRNAVVGVIRKEAKAAAVVRPRDSIVLVRFIGAAVQRVLGGTIRGG